MSQMKVESLNNIDHKDVRIDTTKGASLGDKVMLSMLTLPEFRTAQAYYPVVLHKNAQTGEFYPVALFGFEAEENLFLQGDQWQAGYIPLYQQRGPFLIGQSNGQRVIHINMQHPRVNLDKGEPLFLEYGGYSPYLEQLVSVLETLHQGVEMNNHFIAALLELNLIESFSLEVQLDNHAKHQLLGFYTVNEKNLSELSAEQLAGLNQQGYLEAIYMMLASQSQFAKLVAMKNAQLALT
ncbi:SapC family protein [Bowmanella denitrificans]|uniref:SapC family protein n=1 Tax=Bowmanella denitrificans TaxID=366582 RepID=UPI000C9A142C|nr:SapC family protein [Bowmanella denitrificans]